jgi:MFS family permease
MAHQTRENEKGQIQDIGNTVEYAQEYSKVDLDAASLARENRLVRKIDFRVLPPLAIMFAISIIDRINIGSARVLGMNKDLQLTGNRYNVCLLLFFPAYILAELPSNYFLVKFRPAIWLTLIMFSWGAVLTGMGFTHNWRVLSFLRFLLGIFEGGMLPGMVYIISSWYVFSSSKFFFWHSVKSGTFWYCRFEVHRRIGWAYSVGVLASAFAGVLSYALGLMGGIRHMAGWRWIYSASKISLEIDERLTRNRSKVVLQWLLPLSVISGLRRSLKSPPFLSQKTKNCTLLGSNAIVEIRRLNRLLGRFSKKR